MPRARPDHTAPDDGPDRALKEIFDRLFSAYGPQGWWPGDSPTEVVIGAILTQNTAWTNVERAIDALKSADAVDFGAIDGLDQAALEALIRPAGTYRVKARRLRAFVDTLFGSFGGSLEAMLSSTPAMCRRRLLAIHGVGPETADAILLYAGNHPVFVVDAYTRRVLARHGLIPDDADYDAIQRTFHDALPTDASLFNEYHALLVQVGKRHCRARPLCDGCPLADLQPGPVDAEA